MEPWEFKLERDSGATLEVGQCRLRGPVKES